MEWKTTATKWTLTRLTLIRDLQVFANVGTRILAEQAVTDFDVAVLLVVAQLNDDLHTIPHTTNVTTAVDLV
jgi:hypothetical protein